MIKRQRTTLGVKEGATSGWLLLLWGALLGGCHPKQRAPAAPSYLIVADIEGCVECETKLFVEDFTTLKTTTDTTTKTGQFSLQGKITQPGFYAFGYHSKMDKTVSGLVTLYLPTDSVHLTITKKLIRTNFYQKPFTGSYLKNTVVFSPSPQQQELAQYLLVRDSLWSRYFVDKARVMTKFNQVMGSGNRALVEQWADSARSFDYRISGYWAAAAAAFVRQHPTSLVSLYAMLDNRDDRPAVAQFRQYYQAMPASLRTSFYGRILDQKLASTESRNQHNQRFVGSFIDHLAGKTPTGQKLAVNQLFKRNKLTLIEFWASWCGPCRMELPKYYKLYQQYHRQGFGLLGVSLDNDYNKWVQAIAEDSLRIPHLSELQGGQGEDMRRFDIAGIPANLLVDNTGKIVAVDIPLPKLQKYLQHVL